MPAAQLQLEVTESLAAQDEQVQQRLHELKALGIKLALDDFGTGYSSLSSLHLLPVDTVKIDRSFVSQADTSHHHRVLIEATVKVAQSLGMDTVAEGIETTARPASSTTCPAPRARAICTAGRCHRGSWWPGWRICARPGSREHRIGDWHLLPVPVFGQNTRTPRSQPGTGGKGQSPFCTHQRDAAPRFPP